MEDLSINKHFYLAGKIHIYFNDGKYVYVEGNENLEKVYKKHKNTLRVHAYAYNSIWFESYSLTAVARWENPEANLNNANALVEHYATRVRVESLNCSIGQTLKHKDEAVTVCKPFLKKGVALYATTCVYNSIPTFLLVSKHNIHKADLPEHKDFYVNHGQWSSLKEFEFQHKGYVRIDK